MNKQHLIFLVSSCALAILLSGYYFYSPTIQKKGHSGLRVVSTTTMITDALKRIAGPYAQIKGLMGPGVDPHLYRASARTVQELFKADIIFYHGLHLEGKMADVFEALGKKKNTVAVGDCIDKTLLIESDFEGIYDPHIWHNVSMWTQVVDYISQKLSEVDAEHADFYKSNAQEFIKELEDLQEYVQAQCKTLAPEERILVTAHDAFAYFGRAYGIEVIALQGMNTDAQISPHDVTDLARLVIEKKVKTIFFESSIPQRTMKAVMEAVESYGSHIQFGQELYSDALGDYSGPQGSYISMMHYNVASIVQGLKS